MRNTTSVSDSHCFVSLRARIIEILIRSTVIIIKRQNNNKMKKKEEEKRKRAYLTLQDCLPKQVRLTRGRELEAWHEEYSKLPHVFDKKIYGRTIRGKTNIINNLRVKQIRVTCKVYFKCGCYYN